MSIFLKIKQILGHAEWIKPIVDKNIYGDNKKSYSGNSLNGSNVIVITNLELSTSQVEYMTQALEIEGAYYKVVPWNYARILAEDIREYGGEFIGPFDHVINLISFEEGKTPEIYNLLQTEVDYLVKYTSKSTVTTGIVVSDIKSAETAAIVSLMNGLGGVCANHGIIENGFIADLEINHEDICLILIYLSGKYGQILSGEVLELSVANS